MYQYIRLSVVLTAVVALLSACSKSNDDPTTAVANPEDNSIRFNVNGKRIIEGSLYAPARRTTTYDNNTALQTEGSFTCVAYNAETTTTYISATAVYWNGEPTNKWLFSGGAHYWPLPATNGGAWPSLDFFAYMPATPPSYITAGPTYSYSAGVHSVSFTCANLPMTNAGQGSSLKEFVYAMTLNQNKESNSGTVGLTFLHPFAKIILKISADQPKEVTITSITLKDIYKTGSYTSSGGWTPSGDNTDFVITLNQDYSAHTERVIDVPYIMIPQDWGGEIEVAASWKNWGETVSGTYSATVATNWEAGHSYTYSFKFSDYDLIVNVSKFTEQW